MATIFASGKYRPDFVVVNDGETGVGCGEIKFRSTGPRLVDVLSCHSLSIMLMTGKFPIRAVAGVIWGAQGKEAALLDCQRRLREMGR